MHLATGAVVNAVWDLWAKSVGKPLWRLVADMSPAELVRCIDFRYITDCITPEQALALLRKRAEGKAACAQTLLTEGYPCYTTSVGCDDEKLRHLCQEAVDAGFNHIKLKVGRDRADDVRRLRIAREVLGPDRQLMIDAKPGVRSLKGLGRTSRRTNLDMELDIPSELTAPKRKVLEDQGLRARLVERRRIELPTSALRTRRSPS